MILSTLFKISIIKTLYVNLKLRQFNFPIIVAKGTEIRHLGKITFRQKPRRACVQFGINQLVTDSCSNHSVFDNRGRVEFSGKGKVVFSSGLKLRTDPGAVIKFGDDVYIRTNAILIATERIDFGNRSRLSWCSQITDSNMHYLIDLTTKNVGPKSKPVIIGDDVCIGNHVIIGKGVTLAKGCIVAQNSFVNKPVQEEYCIVAGSPALVVHKNMARIFDTKEEQYWNEHYMTNK